MRGHRIPKLIDGINYNTYRSIKANGIVRERNVIIDGTRQSHGVNAQLAELVGSFVRTVTAANYQPVDTHLVQDIRTLLLAFGCQKLQTAGRLQNGASALDDITDTAQIHRENIAVQQSLVSALDSEHFNAKVDCTAHYCANCGIHALRISSTG
ncbi:hypothetical protein D3C81_1630890 [compost metagenome]